MVKGLCLKAALVSLVLSMVVIPTAFADSMVLQLNNNVIMMDGQPKSMEVAPQLDGNTTMVPLRVISQGMGANVSWNQAQQTVTLKMQDKQIVLKVGSQTAMVNGQAVALDAPVDLNNGSTMVPLRFVGETFNQKVDFNNASKTITLTDKAAVQGQAPTPPMQTQIPPMQMQIPQMPVQTPQIQGQVPTMQMQIPTPMPMQTPQMQMPIPPVQAPTPPMQAPTPPPEQQAPAANENPWLGTWTFAIDKLHGQYPDVNGIVNGEFRVKIKTASDNGIIGDILSIKSGEKIGSVHAPSDFSQATFRLGSDPQPWGVLIYASMQVNNDGILDGICTTNLRADDFEFPIQGQRGDKAPIPKNPRG